MIMRYVALTQPQALSSPGAERVHVHQPEGAVQSRAGRVLVQYCIAEHDEVTECYLVKGDFDYLIRVAIDDMGALEKFMLEQITRISGVEIIRSSFALKQMRYEQYAL